MYRTPLTVVIADDELPLREELRLFPWELSDAKLVGEARNGEEAFRLCRERDPDLIVTDISMPVMDGLALCRLLKEEMPRTQIVLLTCHSDFRFAKEAVRIGALDYIVKGDWDNGQLHAAIDKAREQLEKIRCHGDSIRRERKLLLAKKLAEWLQADPPARAPLAEQLAGTGLAFGLPGRMPFLLVDLPRQDWPLVELELQDVIDQVVGRDGGGGEAVPLPGGKYALALKEQPELPALADKLTRLVTELEAELGRRFSFLRSDVRLCAVISDPVAGEDEMARAVQEAEHWNDARFYDGCGKLFVGAAQPLPVPGRAELAAMEERMRKVEMSSGGLAAFLREEFAEWAARGRYAPSELKRIVLKWRMSWYAEETGEERYGATAGRIVEASTLSQLTAELLYETGARLGQGGKLRAEIAHARRLMEERLGEELTLMQISKEVGLRDHYFSRLFREETGESFHEYLLRLRLDRAVRLLQSSNLKVYEVAERIGIPNYKYFSVLFRKWTGRTPTAFKKNP